jgi:DNA-binding transcriptional ArsR family regulator
MANYSNVAPLDRTFRALGDPTRRAILARLRRGSATVRELAAPFDLGAPTISKHLRVLETSGLIRRRRRGRTHVITLEPAPLGDAEAWLAAYRQFWEQRLDALDAHLRSTEEDPHEPFRDDPY